MIAQARSTGDLVRLCLASFLRAMALSMTAVLLGAWLVARDASATTRGATFATGLGACTLAAALVTWRGDRVGRRGALIVLALLSAAGLAALAASTATWMALAAVGIGMVNAMGKDRGAALILEQAMVPSALGRVERTTAFAWYHLAQDAGSALGSAAAMLPTLLVHRGGIDALAALRWSFALPAVGFLVSAACYAGLTRASEAAPAAMPEPMSPDGRRVVTRLSALFLIDAFGGGFLTTAWITAFFLDRFHAPLLAVSALIAGARLLNAVSHLGAAWLAKRIGLVNTMVFTHIPSSLLLMTVPIAPSFAIAAALFLLREGLVEMDVPTRSSYLMAVVAPRDRTRASGITALVRMGGWTIGQAAAGLCGGAALGASLAVGAGLKVAYDVLLWRAFRDVKPPEETARA